ncbi:MAG: VOC family protein [Propionibacteriaceae bacterium]|nr:VOC family protein [Propionibacteriaceae bacterium]
MGVLRLGYAHIRVTDLAAARRHYVQTMGLIPVLEQGNRLYLKGWDEWDHHSLVLEEGGVGVSKVGFKVAFPDDIDDIEKKARTFGVTTVRMSQGDNPEVSDGLRITLPSNHIVEVYHAQTIVGTEVGDVNPYFFPRNLAGMGTPRIDHALLGCDNVNLSERFFIDAMGMYATERLVPDLDRTDCSLATWLSVGNRGHDIALIQGEGYDAKLHHVAFELTDWSDILHAGQIMAMDDVAIDMGPTAHNITRGKTIYYWDPSGNRNEVFADGYVAQRDRPTIIWTADQVGRGINGLTRTLGETFTTVLT